MGLYQNLTLTENISLKMLKGFEQPDLTDRRGGGGGKRRGLGPRNDVLTTCKAITLRDGQRIIVAFFPQ